MMTLVFLSAAPTAGAVAAGSCTLEQPVVAHGEIHVTISCAPPDRPNGLRYPVGPLFVGISLYLLPEDLAGAVAPLVDEGGADFSTLSRSK